MDVRLGGCRHEAGMTDTLIARRLLIVAPEPRLWRTQHPADALDSALSILRQPQRTVEIGITVPVH